MAGASVYLGAELETGSRDPCWPQGSKAEPQFQPQVHSWACMEGQAAPFGVIEAWDIGHVHPENWASAGAGQHICQGLSSYSCHYRRGWPRAPASGNSVALPLQQLRQVRAGYLSLRMSSCS